MAECEHTPGRRYELDWLRVLVILNLIPLHAAWLMRFIPGFSQVSQEHTGDTILDYYVAFVSWWHMPLLFFIAGTTAYLSLSRRSAIAYLRERVERLLVPLLFFMLAGYPLMVYFLPGAGDNRSSTDFLFRFWPFCLTNPTHNWLAGGRPVIPGWGHLWFVAYLLVISVLTLPLLIHLRRRFSTDLPIGIVRLLSNRWGIFLPAVVFILIRVTLAPRWPLFIRYTLVGDWAYVGYNIVAFLWGFIFSLDAGILPSAHKRYRLDLSLAIPCSILMLVLRFNRPSVAVASCTIPSLLYSCLFGLNTWLWILALLGLARRFLSDTNRFLRYFSLASYPFYILHLVVMTVVGYPVTRWRLGLLPEFLVLCVISFAVTTAIYEMLVKCNRIGRFLLGIKA